MWPDTENVEQKLVFLGVERIRRFGEPCASWRRLGSVLEGLGGVLEASWGRLGASWSVLERLGDVLEASWRVLEAS